MKFRYEALDSHLLVHVEGYGQFNSLAARHAVGEMMRICAEKGIARVLVDGRRIREVVSLADRFGIATFLASKKPRVRIAILVTRTQHDHTKMLEHTAVNRGVAMKTTADEKEAKEFLGID